MMSIQYSTEDFCAICYEPYKDSTGHDAFRLKCQHAFGRSCINSWATKSTICPACGLNTFPAELSGGLNTFRRLADRTVFAADPPNLRIGPGVGLGLGVGLGALAGTIAAGVAGVAIAADAVKICALVTAGVCAFRGITLGNEVAFTCSYLLGISAGLVMSALIIKQQYFGSI